MQRAGATEQQLWRSGLRLEQALLLLARVRRGLYAIVWCARDALNLFRPMDRLAQAQLSGEYYASS
jgi:hypothetical protein